MNCLQAVYAVDIYFVALKHGKGCFATKSEETTSKTMLHSNFQNMFVRATTAILFLIFVTICGSAQVKTPKDSRIIEVDLCTVMRNPKAYDRKVIRTKAIYYSGYHGSGLYADQCNKYADSLAIDGSEISTKYVTTKSIEKKFEEIIYGPTSDESREARVTVVGIFYDWDGNGYGHMNWLRFKFSLFAFTAIERVQKQTQSPQGESGFMGVVEHLRTINQIWNQAYLNGPISQFKGDEILAKDYTYTDSPGTSLDKSQFAERISKTDSQGAKQSAVNHGRVLFRGNIAVVTGGAVSYDCPNLKVKEYRFENTFKKIGSIWMLVNSKITNADSGIRLSCY